MLAAVVAVGALSALAHAGELGHGRSYELVSPPDRRAGEVVSLFLRTRAAGDGNAVAFASLTGFADVHGFGAATEYLATRSGGLGTNGWATHGVTPPQGAGSFAGKLGGSGPLYTAYSENLATAVFSAWTPLTDVPAVANAVNLYLRRDMYTPGRGSYELITACPLCVTPLSVVSKVRPPKVAGTSEDIGHVVFESTVNLAQGASGGSTKTYEWDQGAVRLVGVLPTGRAASRSILGRGVPAGTRTAHPISVDGSHVFFTVPSSLALSNVSGAVYVRVNGRTTVQVNANERGVPDVVQPATYWDASRDGSRAFFTSARSLTDDAPLGPPKLYMWERQATNETQTVTVSASGGTYTLTLEGMETSEIPFDAPSADVESALTALPGVGSANVTVSGGPGEVAGATPYVVTFIGDLSGVNVAELSADGSALTGGAATATVETTAPLRNLTQLDTDQEPGDGIGGTAEGVIGISDAGDSVSFAAQGQRVEGAPALAAGVVGIYRWHEGSVDFVGASENFSGDRPSLIDNPLPLTLRPRQTQVTPDGGHMLFISRSGVGLLSAHGAIDYDHGSCAGSTSGCQELYVYSADTKELRCASCNPSGAPATANATARTFTPVAGAAEVATYLSRPMSDDGRFVFFNTGEALVSEDVNGRSDAYEFDVARGSVHLLSSGTHPADSWFLDASRDGEDVFFATRERLLGWDDDEQYDLYDARVGAGFPEPPAPTPGCTGDACQGDNTGVPAVPSIGSMFTMGAGNVAQGNRVRSPSRPKRCRRGTVAKRVGKVKCVKRRPSGKAKGSTLSPGERGVK